MIYAAWRCGPLSWAVWGLDVVVWLAHALGRFRQRRVRAKFSLALSGASIEEEYQPGPLFAPLFLLL